MIRSSNLIVFLGLAFALAFALLWVFGMGLAKARAAVGSPLGTYVVSNTNDSGPGSLRQAIADANASLGAGLISITASGTVQLLSPLPVITETVTIQGPGAGLFTVDGNSSFRVLDIDATSATLADLTIQNGNVTGNTEYGAGIRSTGILNLQRVEVLSNTAQSHGGGLYAVGNIEITEGVIQNNRSTNGVGGGMRTLGITVISGTQVLGNSSQGDGGGAFVLDELVVTNALFQENICTAGSCDGAGLFSFSHTDIHNTQFISNTAQDQAGGVAAPGVLTITGGLFQNNQAVFGTGGAVYAQDMVTIQDTQFLSNTARSFGGGMYAFASADLTGVLFQNNQSTIGTGGGLYAAGSMYLDRSQFIRNTARQGGGLTHALGAGLLVNSLFAENVATDTPGMAMLLASAGPVEVRHVTIAGPPAASGTGIEVVAGSAGITNTIITDHTIAINNTGASVGQDFNLFFGNGLDTQGGVSGGANSLTGDPLFVNPTGDDYHLSMGSPAIDAGTDAGVITDFEGDARPLDGGFDIGFDEWNQTPGTETFRWYMPLILK